MARLAPAVSWLWWNPAGFAFTVTSALMLTGAWPKLQPIILPRREGVLLTSAFGVMLGILVLLQWC